MQASEYFRRGVVRPLNQNARDQLDCFAVLTSIRVEWIPILGDSDFEAIWETGVLQNINEACGIQITDYEETVVESAKISRALSALTAVDQSHFGQPICEFFQSLRELFVSALDAEMPVYFIL